MNYNQRHIKERSSKIKSKSPSNLNTFTIQRSNSDTKLAMIHFSERHNKSYQTENYDLEKYKFNKRYTTTSLRLNKMLKKDKRRLRDYIVNNPKYIKLFGNKRYHNNPLLYVQDHKKKLDDRQMGLVPVPNKNRKKLKTVEDKKQLYDLQRSIVMMRRFQYNRKYYQNLNFGKKLINTADVIKIQRWWRKMLKVIKIQSCVRGMLLRKEIRAVQKLFLFMNGFENTLLKIFCRQAMFKISQNIIVKKEMINIGHITKLTLLVNNDLRNVIIAIQSKYRQHSAKKKRDKILKELLPYKVVNKDFYLTKCVYSKQKVNHLLSIICRKFRKYLFLKNKIILKKVLPSIVYKEYISHPYNAAKLIQQWFRRHHYFICNENKNSASIPKDKQWSYYTRKKINEKVLENAFIKPKKELTENKIKNIWMYINKPCFISKKRTTDINNKINTIQRAIKQLGIVRMKANVFRPNNKCYFVSKLYIDFSSQKLKQFILKVSHFMKINVFKKPKTYVPLNEYTEKNIHAIEKIQNKFKKHFYNNSRNIKQRVYFKPYNIGYISIIRLFNNNEKIMKVQQNIKQHIDTNLYYTYNTEKNKPDKKVCYITKTNIKNVDDLVKVIQFNYRSHILRKKLKTEKDCINYQIKGKLNNQSFFTKIIIDNQNSLEQLTLIQTRYKQRFKKLNEDILDTPEIILLRNILNSKEQPIKSQDNKHNIISIPIDSLNKSKQDKNKLFNELLANLNKNSDPSKINDIIKNNFNLHSLTLNDLIKYNSKPKSDYYNHYISKTRRAIKYGFHYSFTYNDPLRLPLPKICYVDKIHIQMNASQVKKIQRVYKTYKEKNKQLISGNKIFCDPSSINALPSHSSLLIDKLKNKENDKDDSTYLELMNPSKCFYVSKIRIVNNNKNVKHIQEMYHSYSSQKKNEEDIIKITEPLLTIKSNPSANCFMTKTRISKKAHSELEQNLQEHNNPIKSTFLFKDFTNEQNRNNNVNNSTQLIHSGNISNITKLRKRDFVHKIKLIQANFKKHNHYKQLLRKTEDSLGCGSSNNNIYPVAKKGTQDKTKEKEGKTGIVDAYIPITGYISKIVKSNLKNDINKLIFLQRNGKSFLNKNNKEKEIFKSEKDTFVRPYLNNICYYSKKRLYNNEKSITLIQKLYKNSLTKHNENKAKTISRSIFRNNFDTNSSCNDRLSNPSKVKGISNYQRHSLTSIDLEREHDIINNYDNNNNPFNSLYGSAQSGNANAHFISKTNKKIITQLPAELKYYFADKTRYLFISTQETKIKTIQRNIKLFLQKRRSQRQFKNSLSQSQTNFHIHPIIYPKRIESIYPPFSYITKQIYKVKEKPIQELPYISLLTLFAVKNSQEFCFFKLKYNYPNINIISKQEHIKKPLAFYYNVLYRTIKFLKSNPNNIQNKAISFLTNTLEINKNYKTPIHKIIASLSKNQTKSLQTTNIFSSCEPDFIDYLCLFSKYDKQLANEAFITERLKRSKINNTNVFAFVRFIDEEYENLANGKYCMKCYLGENSCHCTKKSSENDEDEAFEMDISNDEFTSKKLINHFEYDSTKCKGILIKRKPKIEESYEDPITHMIINSNSKKQAPKIISQKIIEEDVKVGNDESSSGKSGHNGNERIRERNIMKQKKEIENIRKILHNDNIRKNQLVIRDNTFQTEDNY